MLGRTLRPLLCVDVSGTPFVPGINTCGQPFRHRSGGRSAVSRRDARRSHEKQGEGDAGWRHLCHDDTPQNGIWLLPEDVRQAACDEI